MTAEHGNPHIICVFISTRETIKNVVVCNWLSWSIYGQWVLLSTKWKALRQEGPIKENNIRTSKELRYKGNYTTAEPSSLLKLHFL